MAQARCLTIAAIPRSSRPARPKVRPPDRLQRIIEKAVSEVFAIDISQMHAEARGRAQIALARQVAMYLMHCTFSVSLTDVGRLFARDRTTVGHACKLIEDRRDEPSFDVMLNNLEEIVRRLAQISGANRGA